MHPSNQVSVRVLKYNGTEYRRWNARIARREGPLIVLDAKFEIDVSHDLLGSIPRGTRTVEYYWLDRWYNVFRFLDDVGGTRLYYCNVNTPPSFEGDKLTYTDLDIDLLVQPDFSYQALDLDEFAENATRYNYSDEVKQNAHMALDDLTGMIESHQFPFHLDSSSVANNS